MECGTFAVIIIAVVIIIVIIWWYLGVYAANYPAPSKPSADYNLLLSEFYSIPKSLWLQNSTCVFNEWLLCRPYRYIVYESDGRIIYDNADQPGWKFEPPIVQSAKQIRYSVEYNRAWATTEGGATRIIDGHKIANVAEMVKDGNYYRLVHLSQYIYRDS